MPYELLTTQNDEIAVIVRAAVVGRGFVLEILHRNSAALINDDPLPEYARPFDGKTYARKADAVRRAKKLTLSIGKDRTSAGRKAADRSTGLVRKQVMLDPESERKLRAAGDGELSAGIRAVARSLP